MPFFSKIKEKIVASKLKEKLLDSERARKIYVSVLLAGYLIMVIWAIVFKCNVNKALNIDKNLELSLWERFTRNLLPFREIVVIIIVDGFVTLDMLAFIMNVIIFMPLGMLLLLIMSKKWSVLSMMFFSISVEIFQLFTGFGGLDTTDVMLNTLGGYLGCEILVAARKKMSDRVINAIMLALLLPTSVFAVFVTVRTIINFPI